MANVSPVGGDGNIQQLTGAVTKLFGLFRAISELSNAGDIQLSKKVETTTDRETRVRTTTTIIVEEHDPKKAAEALTSQATLARIAEGAQGYVELITAAVSLTRRHSATIDGEPGEPISGFSGPTNIFDFFKATAKAQPNNPLNNLAAELGVTLDDLLGLVKQFVDQRKDENTAELERIFPLIQNFETTGIIDATKQYIASQSPPVADTETALKELVEKHGGFDRYIESIEALKKSKEANAQREEVETERDRILDRAYQLRNEPQTSDKKPSQVVALEAAILEVANNIEAEAERILAKHGGYETLQALLKSREE